MRYIKTILPTALALGALLPLSPAQAADGTINFRGSVTSQTCKASGNGGSTSDFTVMLPNVSVVSLAVNGKTAGRTPFTIALSNCNPKTGYVRAMFEAGTSVDSVTGRLRPDAGGAVNVQVGLANADFSDIKIGQTLASQNTAAVTLVDGNATLRYFAQYVATGAAGSGAVNTRVTYVLVYD